MHTRRTNTFNTVNSTDTTDTTDAAFATNQVVWCTYCRCGMTGNQLVVSHSVNPVNMCMRCALGSITSSEYNNQYRQATAREYLKEQQDVLLFVYAAENILHHQKTIDSGESEEDPLRTTERLLNSICSARDDWAADLSSALSIEEDMESRVD